MSFRSHSQITKPRWRLVKSLARTRRNVIEFVDVIETVAHVLIFIVVAIRFSDASRYRNIGEGGKKEREREREEK